MTRTSIETRLRKVEANVPGKVQRVLRVVAHDRAECERVAPDNPGVIVICRLIVEPPNYERAQP